MAEESDAGSPERRATWVALRTLRQRPTVVGHTSDGQTVFEIRAVRLVLAAGAPYFHRLVSCAKCGSELTGPAVLAPADLDQPTNSRICHRCVRSAVPAYRGPEKRPAERSAAPAARPEVAVRVPEAAVPVDDERVAPGDAQLAEVTARLIALAEGRAALEHRIESQAVALTGLVDGLRSDFEKALESAVQHVLMATAEPIRDLERSRDQIQVTLAALQRQVAEGDLRARALEERLDGSVERLTDLVAVVTRPPQSHRGDEPVAGGLLAGLDWQLREAEGRLAQHRRASQEDPAPASR